MLVSDVNQHGFEFCHRYRARFCQIMLVENFIKILLKKIVTESVHSTNEIFPANLSISVTIKKTEYSPGFIVVSNLLNIDTGCHEFCIIYFLIPIVITLLDHLGDFFVRNIMTI